MKKEQINRKKIMPPVIVYYCSLCGEQLREKIFARWFDIRSGSFCADFLYKCPKSGMFNFVKGLWGQSHTCIKVAEDGTEVNSYSGM